jgi:putative ABC transport system permease protein
MPFAAQPPRLLLRVLLSLLPASAADEIAGDLHEEFVTIARRAGPVRAWFWYAGQVARIGLRTLVRRAAGPRRDPHLSPAGDSLMRSLVTDIRHALRGLGKRPALGALVVVTLALGLGANATIFALIDAVILRPFTVPNLDRVVMVGETAPYLSFGVQESVSPANYRDWKRQADVFDRMAAFEWWDVNLSGGDEPERVSGFFVGADFFPALGVEPVRGRAFTPDEETRGRHQRVILGYDLWQRRFAGDPAVVGATIQLDAQPYEVVGVAPAGFSFPLGSQLWAPLAFDENAAARRSDRALSVIARLAPGNTIDEASAQMAVIAERLAQQYPESNKGHGARVVTLIRGIGDPALGPIAVMWQAAAGFVLLIACANIANLLLARGAERQRELAVRTALGASRRRIVRELLVESLVLAMAAVPIALAVAWIGTEVIRVNMPASLLRFLDGWQSMDVDGRLLAFTVAAAALTALVFGLLPALRASRPALSETLKDSGRATTAGRNRQRLRATLVVGEVALALPLLVASGISTVGAWRFLNGPQGFEPEGLYIMRAVLPEGKYADPLARQRFVDALLLKLAAIPGVRSAAAANVLPAGNGSPERPIEIEGQARPADAANPVTVGYRSVSPDLFATMQIPMLRGRGFTGADGPGALDVAIISKSAADRHFPGADPLGRRVRLGDGPWLTVVGVAGDVIHQWFNSRHAPTLYRPYAQAPTFNVALALRAEGHLAALAAPSRAAVRAVDPSQPVFDQMSMREALQVRTIGLQYVAGIMGTFGALALALAVVGVYSVMAFVMAQRTHEIGVRIALGAARTDVLRLTVGHAARLAGAGVAIGLALAAGVERVMNAALEGVFAADVRLSLAFAAILLLSAIAAAYLPGRRATRIDPLIALRAD